MKLQQLRFLLAIVENDLNITSAAAKLYTSQPGVSKQLKKLEEELGLQLFVRRGKCLSEITPAGRAIIRHASAILAEVDKIRQVAADPPGSPFPLRRMAAVRRAEPLD